MLIGLLILIVLIMLFGRDAVKGALGGILAIIGGFLIIAILIDWFGDYITFDGVFLTILGFLAFAFLFSLWDKEQQAKKDHKSDRDRFPPGR